MRAPPMVPELQFESALVLLNPRAAGGRAARIAEPLRRWLEARAAGATLSIATDAADARSVLLGRPAGSRVVLIGGDGTLHQMLPALLARQLSVGLVPVGSGNDMARALGLSGLRWDAALAIALHGAACRCDVGELVIGDAGVPFASSLAVGFDAAVARRAADGPAWLGGLPRYLWATLSELAALRRLRVRAIVDGTLAHDGEALFASCLNTPSYGAGMPAVPHARIDDGRLDLLVAGRFGRLGALAMLPRLLTGTHLGHARVSTAAFSELQLECDDALPLAADGEPLGAARKFAVRVLPGALQVVSASGTLPPR